MKWGIIYLFFMYQRDKTITQVASAKEKHQGCFANKGHLLNFFSFSKDMLQPHEKLTFNKFALLWGEAKKKIAYC